MTKSKPKTTSPSSRPLCSPNYSSWANCSPKTSLRKKKSLQQSGPPIGPNQQRLHNKGQRAKPYLSIFGMITIQRSKYYSPETGTYYALDAQLNLPKGRYSYLLQSWIARAASGEAFGPSLEMLNEILGQHFQAMTAQRISHHYGHQVDAYYQVKSPVPPEAEGAALGVSFDGKGVPIIKSERAGVASQTVRLMKGQKRGTKKQATVSVSFSFDPVARTPEEVAKSLHRRWNEDEKQACKRSRNQAQERGQVPPRQAQHVHKRAFLGPQRKALDYGVADLKQRQGASGKPIIVLIDGHAGLVEGVPKALSEAGLSAVAVILDIVHVSEYLWRAATALLGEANPQRERWVYARLLALLESRVEEVIAELEAIETPPKAVLEAMRYFGNHRHMMDYKQYLACGYPVSTGLVEGSCGHLVKDRMEGSGMRWSVAGAQQVLNTRAVNKNGDWEDYSRFVKEQAQPRVLKHAA